MATGIFALLCLLWIAIWIIDFCYYNRLLAGAATALIALEDVSKTKRTIRYIDLSTTIERAVAGEFVSKGWRARLGNWRLGIGRWAFYCIINEGAYQHPR
jgi:hypothetical protein